MIQDTVQEGSSTVSLPTVKSIQKLIEGVALRVNYRTFMEDIFTAGAICISNLNEMNKEKYTERENQYKKIMEGYEPSEIDLIKKVICQIFDLCSSCTLPKGKFGDFLGELYMQSGGSSDKAGQFFTPFDVSKACAEVCIDGKTVKQKRRKGEILTISEPACGSGGMILAVLDTLWNKYDFNYAQNCFVEASDIDQRCVHMCYIQLSLAGVPAIIKQQDALSRKIWDVWYTPSYLFQYLRFRQFEKCANM